MLFKVKHLQCSEEHILLPSEFCMYLVGLCASGRDPILHISSIHRSDGDYVSVPDCNFDYSVLIDFDN